MSNHVPRRRSRVKSVKIDASKIAKLVRLLASDRPGEVVAAAAALTRVLQAGGRDWHDLAAVVEAGLGGQQPAAQHQSRTWAPPLPDPNNWQALAWFAHYYGHDLSGYQREFVADMLLGTGAGFDDGRIRGWAVLELRRIVASLRAA